VSCIGPAVGCREEYACKCLRYIRRMKGTIKVPSLGQVPKQNCFTVDNKKWEYRIKRTFPSPVVSNYLYHSLYRYENLILSQNHLCDSYDITPTMNILWIFKMNTDCVLCERANEILICVSRYLPRDIELLSV
jgi:hypothetical protein